MVENRQTFIRQEDVPFERERLKLEIIRGRLLSHDRKFELYSSDADSGGEQGQTVGAGGATLDAQENTLTVSYNSLTCFLFKFG